MITKISSPKVLTKDKKDNLGELWSEIRYGNPNALSKLFRFSYTWLFNYGYKIVPKEAFVKDAIQELFLNLWKKKDAINEAKSVKGYLFSSLRRIIFRRLRKQRNRTERNHNYEKYLFTEIYNIEELMIHFETDQEKKEQLKLAIRSLSKRQKEAIYLKFYNGLSNTEIARVMDINKQSVYNHVSEAIDKMKEYVKA